MSAAAGKCMARTRGQADRQAGGQAAGSQGGCCIWVPTQTAKPVGRQRLGEWVRVRVGAWVRVRVGGGVR